MNYPAKTVGRGRPRKFDPHTALAAALRVFWQRGFEGASIAVLAEAMGIAKPSLYACFGDKEALFRKALDLYERENLAYLRQALQGPTARDVAERLLLGALAAHGGGDDPRGCLNIMSTMNGFDETDAIRKYVRERRASAVAAIERRFARARGEGDLPPDIDAKALASGVSAFLSGLAVEARSGATHEELRAIVDMFLAIWPSP